MYKWYALGLSIIIIWCLPSVIVIPLISCIMYTHPWSYPLFYSLDKWMASIVPKKFEQSTSRTPETTTVSVAKPSTPTSTSTSTVSVIPDLNVIFCRHVTKLGKRCRGDPGTHGWCKRHIKTASPAPIE